MSLACSADDEKLALLGWLYFSTGSFFGDFSWVADKDMVQTHYTCDFKRPAHLKSTAYEFFQGRWVGAFVTSAKPGAEMSR